jgi:hypothetical protein
MMPGINGAVRAQIKASFINHCIEAVNIGYNIIIANKSHQLDWLEDNLTAHLVETIELSGFLTSFQISINYQPPIVNYDIAFQGADFLTAPKVDFKFSTWSGPKEIKFYAEAKNLSERDWHKASGALVKSSKQRGRYLDTGVENFLSNRYPEGCLVGYVLNGSTAAIVNNLNSLIKRRKLGPRIGFITLDHTATWPICYYSDNEKDGQSYRLVHLMLQLA